MGFFTGGPRNVPGLFDPASYNISLYSLPTFVTMLAILLLGVLALVHERISSVSLSFFVMTLAVSLWLCAQSILYSTTNEGVALWWAKAAYLGVPFIAAALYHFTVTVLRIFRRNAWAAAAAWVGAASFSAAAIFTDALVGKVRLFWWGYYAQYNWLGAVFIVCFIGVLLAGMLHYWLAYRALPPGRHRRRVLSLMVAFGVGYLGAADLIPAYGVPLYPFGYLGILGFVVLAARAIFVYRLVDITPAFAATEIVETMNDALLVLDREGIIRVANRAAEEMFGRSTTENVSRPVTEILNDPLFSDSGRFASLIEAGRISNYELNDAPRGGEERCLSLSASVMRDRGGEPAAIVCIVRDITERKRAEEEVKRLNEGLERRVAERTEQLQAAVKELEAFSYSVSHDLRSPLRAITGFSNAVLEDFGEEIDPSGRRYLTLIRENAENMGQLIDDLLAFSRLGRQQMERSLIDMEYLAESVWDEIMLVNPEREIEFKVMPLPPALGDRAMVRQVFVNLLSNAVKYTRHREVVCVEVGAEKQDGENVYYVKDNGAGFDMRYAHKLFGVFQRLHSTREFEGTGVGLALVQRVVKRHDGRIWAQARVNEGATFYFTLPTGRENGEGSQRSQRG